MKILVLGGNGFIGSHLVDKLLTLSCDIRVFDRSIRSNLTSMSNIEVFSGDYSKSNDLAEALTGVDVVVHMISTTVPSTASLDPSADVSGNLINSIQLLNLMIKQRVRKIVYLSSGGTVYGIPQYSPINELHPTDPICSYGIVKLAIEKYIRLYAHTHRMEHVILRASNPYGPRQGNAGVQGVVGTYLRNIRDDHPIELWGDGSAVRDFLYVEDLAELVARAVFSDQVGCFNAGAGIGKSILEVIGEIRNIVGKPLKIRQHEAKTYDVPASILNSRASQEAFNWRPETSFTVGLQKTWDSLQTPAQPVKQTA